MARAPLNGVTDNVKLFAVCRIGGDSTQCTHFVCVYLALGTPAPGQPHPPTQSAGLQHRAYSRTESSQSVAVIEALDRMAIYKTLSLCVARVTIRSSQSKALSRHGQI